MVKRDGLLWLLNESMSQANWHFFTQTFCFSENAMFFVMLK